MRLSVLDKICHNGKIIVYGAGKYADALYRALYYLRRDVVVKAFAVTSSESSKYDYYGKPILEFDAIASDDYDCIVVAMADKNQKEIANIIGNELNKPVIWMKKEDLKSLREALVNVLSDQEVDYNKIVFDCFHGAGYSDNVKYIAENIHRRNEEITMYWYVEDAVDAFPEYVIPFRYSDLHYYDILYSSGIIISNNGTNFMDYKKNNRQYLINTWHGIDGIKKVGMDSSYEANDNLAKAFYIEEFGKIDLMIAGSKFNHYLYRHSLCYKNEIANWGYARNDILIESNRNKRKIIRERIGLNKETLFVLYAPTYRSELVDARTEDEIRCTFDMDFLKVKKAISDKFGEDVWIAYKLHHALYRNPVVKNLFSDIYNLTDYPDIQELLLAADVLITDYSSCMWDYSLMYKPVFLYLKDIEKYTENPGFYHSPKDFPFPHGFDTDQLCDAIREFDEQKYKAELVEYHKKMERYDDGHASERVADRIFDVIANPEKYTR